MAYSLWQNQSMAFRFEHLDIWKNAVDYCRKIYMLTKKFPSDELFALTNQLRRAAYSVPTNIAEGSGSSSRKDFFHYLDIAIKSIYETVSLLYLAKEQNYISEVERIAFYEEAEILVKKIKVFQNTLRP